MRKQSCHASVMPRRRTRQHLGALQVSGLAALLLLCAAYIYLVSHSPRLVEDHGFHRSRFRRQARRAQLPRSVRFGAGAGDAGVFPATRGEADTWLLLASHNRLLQFNYVTGAVRVVHEGQGVYYGLFPSSRVDAQGRPTSVWVASRPHNWHPQSTVEQLLEIDMATGAELQAVKLDARFTHDVARRADRVYACSTGEGAILELSLPSLQQVRKLELFSAKEHVNSVAPLQQGSLWALLHNLGESQLVKVDLETATVVRRFSNIGTKSHGLVAWRGSLLVLDSEGGRLLRVNPRNGSHTSLYQVPERDKFQKGLAVIDDIAYFGISASSTRAARGDAGQDSELAAFCLRGMALLWRRTLPTHGLLNIVAAPHLAVASTYRALEPQLPRTKRDAAVLASDSAHVTRHASGGGVRTAARTLAEFPALIGGSWASGQPCMDLALKRQHPERAGMQLNLLQVDSKPLQDALAAAGEHIWQPDEQRRSNAVFEGRDTVLQRFKPGVETVSLIFSDRGGDAVYQFPWYSRFRAALEPMLHQVLGAADAANIIRVQLARMSPGVRINLHTDWGDWATHSHRIHIPITSAPGVAFEVCTFKQPLHVRHSRRHEARARSAADGEVDCWPVATQQGQAFEINNNLPHKVQNNSSAPRVHLILDVAETRHERTPLKAGQVCRYKEDVVVCQP